MPFIPPLLRPLAPLPAHFSVFFISSLFVSLHARILSLSLPLSLILHRFEAEIETGRGPRPLSRLYCATLRFQAASTFPPHLPFFPPFSFRYFYALARNISRASRVFTPRKKMVFFRHGTSNRIVVRMKEEF